MKKKALHMLAWLLALVILFSVASVSVMAVPENDNNVAASAPDSSEPVTSTYGEYDYILYKNSNADVPMAKEDIVLPAINYTSEEGSGVMVGEKFGKSDVLIWESGKGSVTYTFDVPTDAIYNIEFEYVLLDSSENDLSLGIQIDGEYPFFGADDLELPRMWMDAADFRVDDIGNQFAPEQTSYEDFVKKAVYDVSGASVYPMEFKFTKGKHTVTVVNNSESLVVSNIALIIPESDVLSYAEISKTYKQEGYKSVSVAPIIAEGERPSIKSTRSLVPYADNSSNLVTPSSPTISQLNYIGGANWALPNEEIVWIIDVPEDGLYNLGITFRQDQVVNGFSYRHLKIDGKTPFKECTNLQFNYDTGWQNFEFGNENGLYDFYLTKGTHKVSLAGTMGNLAPSYYKLKTVTSEIGSFYIEVVMITSESPDRNRDYELFRTVPQFNERLQKFSDELRSLVAEMQLLSGESGSSYIAAMNNMARVLDSMRNDKYNSHLYVSDFYSQYTTLSSWLYEMQKMPMCIDRIQFVTSGSEFQFKESKFIKDFVFGAKRFFASFDEAYSRVSVAKKGTKSIKIWVNWGRDQAQVLNNLINESFVPYAEKELGYPVSVNLELVNADIIKGMLSGNAPDLSLHMPRSTPINLALRGALVDLNQFKELDKNHEDTEEYETFDEVMNRFGATATIPYEYKSGLYALPDQQSFYIMFYRHDIFEQLNLEVPQTWDEYLAVTAVLQRNNMNSYLPYTF